MLSDRTIDILIKYNVPYEDMDQDEIIEVLTAIVEIENTKED